MTSDYTFLSVEDVIHIHTEELTAAGGLEGIRDIGLLESAVAAPQASHDGKYLMNIFEMSASYLNSIAFNHPFNDGNKRTALAAALTFLYLNGFETVENYDEELADKTLDLISRKISKTEMAEHLKLVSKEIL